MPSYFMPPQEYGEFPKTEVNAILQGVTAVMESWAHLPSRYIGVPVEGPASLPLEFSVRFSGYASGFLNVRTSIEMARALVRQTNGKNVTRVPVEDVFKEFVDIFSGKLMAYLWGNNWGLLKMEMPTFTQPKNWPEKEPTACCAFIVENWPVEVRLWIDAGAE